MRVLSILLLPLAVASFSLDSRRQALAKTSIAFVTTVVGPNAAKAFSQQLDDNIVEPSQQPTNGKVDLNGAFIGDYKQFPGMYPHAAGKIASNGPYSSVSFRIHISLYSKSSHSVSRANLTIEMKSHRPRTSTKSQASLRMILQCSRNTKDSSLLFLPDECSGSESITASPLKFRYITLGGRQQSRYVCPRNDSRDHLPHKKQFTQSRGDETQNRSPAWKRSPLQQDHNKCGKIKNISPIHTFFHESISNIFRRRSSSCSSSTLEG